MPGPSVRAAFSEDATSTMLEVKPPGCRQWIDHHPAGRFWALRRRETALYLALALLLAGFITWWVRARVS